MSDYLTDQLNLNRLHQIGIAEGYSADDIRAMDMRTFAALRARAGYAPVPDPIAQAMAQVNATVPPPATATAATGATEQTEEQPAGMTLEEAAAAGVPGAFEAWRASRNSSGEGKGLFDAVSGSKSEAYNSAAHAQAGRTGMVTSNVIPSPAIARPDLRHVDLPDLDRRTAAQRFGM